MSAPNTGASFHVYLRVLDEIGVEAEAILRETPRGDGQRVLYLDDEEPLVYLMTRVLERLGYCVIAFTGAGEALAAFRENPYAFDVVVTDLSMPGMSGADFAKHVLALRPDMPVVMTSGYVSTNDHEVAVQSGVRELILKPNTVDELGDVLHRLLSEPPGGEEPVGMKPASLSLAAGLTAAGRCDCDSRLAGASSRGMGRLASLRSQLAWRQLAFGNRSTQSTTGLGERTACSSVARAREPVVASRPVADRPVASGSEARFSSQLRMPAVASATCCRQACCER